MKLEYSYEKRQNIPKEGLPLVNFQSPTRRDDIPIKIDWPNRPWTITSNFPEYAERNGTSQVRSDDVWILGQQKCGTTWMQEIIWLLTHDFDFETMSNVISYKRTLNFEFTGVYKNAIAEKFQENFIQDVYDTCDALASPRVLKSHLPANMLPYEIWTKKPKIIYITRNVKDSILSRYHMYKGFNYWKGDMKPFLDAFLNDDLAYLPYWPHILEFWQIREQPNVYFTSYENLKKDLKGSLRKICKFLERPFTEELLDKAVFHLSFENMKNSKGHQEGEEMIKQFRKAVGLENNDFEFLRKGKVGSFKEELPEGYAEKLDEWSASFLGKAGLTMDDILNYEKEGY